MYLGVARLWTLCHILLAICSCIMLFLRGALELGKEKAVVQVIFSGYALAAPC